MTDLFTMRREMRYGIPAADQVIFNREYSIGYSYYFRQAKWALEVVDKDNRVAIPHTSDIERLNNFRADYRLPEVFRAEKIDYQRSGYDRGHLICSADKNHNVLENSETFLLSNISPQTKNLNRKKWRNLERLIREYDLKEDIYETHVICGPIFYFNQEIKVIGADDSNEVSIPIPHAFFKSVLSEDKKGNINIWSFILPNQEEDILKPLKNFLVPTTKVEKLSGLFLWEALKGTKMEKQKNKVSKANWLFDK